MSNEHIFPERPRKSSMPADDEITILRQQLVAAQKRVKELEPAPCCQEFDTCTQRCAVLAETWRITAQKTQERVRELEIVANAWHCVFGTSQLSHARAKLESEIDGRKRAEAALAEGQAKIDALMLEYCPDEMTKEQL